MLNEARLVMERLMRFGPDDQGMEDKLAFVQALRSQSPELSRQLDQVVIEQLMGLRAAVEEAGKAQEKLRALHAQLTAPPLFPATFTRYVAPGKLAEVVFGGSRRVVTLVGELAQAPLVRGDEVLLSHELNAALAKSSGGPPLVGETAYFDRQTEDGRLVLRTRDEEVVAEAAGALDVKKLKSGDVVRWCKDGWMVYERLDGGVMSRFSADFDELPDIGRDAIGGQDENLSRLFDSLFILARPERARAYGLENAKGTILLVGPPGCGKTLMAKVAACELRRRTGRKCRFAAVKPGEWESPFVGVTQENIRRTFKALREAAEDGFAVLFLDEIEVIARTRGSFVGHHSDRFLGAFLVEVDGFVDRKNIAIISATNRKDLLDPAVRERLSGEEIEVTRPDRQGARAIFAIHLPAHLPYRSNGSVASKVREEMIECAVAKFYSEGPETELCVVHFRDHTQRVVRARELVSGRLFAQVCRAACRAALLRAERGGEEGLTVEDIEAAASRALRSLATTITPSNARDYLDGLDDRDVVRVEPIVRRVREPRRYLNLALS